FWRRWPSPLRSFFLRVRLRKHGEELAMSTHDVVLQPDDTVGSGKGQEHWVVPSSISTRPQVRLERTVPGEASPKDYALYTSVPGVTTAGVVRIGHRAESTFQDLRDRLGLTEGVTSQGRVNTQVAHPTYTEAEAEAHGEFIERLTDNGVHRGLVVLAPHGGGI